MNEHTSNPYATYGPNDGTNRSWHEYFIDLRASFEARVNPEVEDNEDEDETGTEVLVPVRIATPEEREGCAILQVEKLANANDFETHLGYCKSFKRGVAYKGGQKEGQLREDVTMEQLILIGYKRGYGWFKLWYTRRNGAKWVRDVATINGEYAKFGDKTLKDWIKGEVHDQL